MTPARSYLAGCISSALVFAGLMVLTGAAQRHVKYDEITVGRINIEEPDGTKRLIISNRAQFPGSFIDGKEIARPDRRSFAGMLFVDESGNENGGLIQKGSVGPNGLSAGVSLTFDRYRQDQTLQLLHQSSSRGATTNLFINDVPDAAHFSMEDVQKWKAETAELSLEERRAAQSRLAEQDKLARNRVTLGTSRDKASMLGLSDAKGRPRLLLVVSAEGQPKIVMLDEAGKEQKTIVP